MYVHCCMQFGKPKEMEDNEQEREESVTWDLNSTDAGEVTATLCLCEDFQWIKCETRQVVDVAERCLAGELVGWQCILRALRVLRARKARRSNMMVISVLRRCLALSSVPSIVFEAIWTEAELDVALPFEPALCLT